MWHDSKEVFKNFFFSKIRIVEFFNRQKNNKNDDSLDFKVQNPDKSYKIRIHLKFEFSEHYK